MWNTIIKAIKNLKNHFTRRLHFSPTSLSLQPEEEESVMYVR